MNHFSITPHGPFSFSLAMSVLRKLPMTSRHARGSTSTAVRLAFSLDGTLCPVAVAVRWDGTALHGTFVGTDDGEAVKAQTARIFSLDHDARPYAELGRREPRLGALMDALPGLRPVCFTSPYEAAVWAILSQRISSTQATVLLERLIAKHGVTTTIDGHSVGALPPPVDLARVTDIAGLPALKIERLHGVATAAREGVLDARRLDALGPGAAMASLQRIAGIGPFWSAGIYMRAGGTSDWFPDEPLSIAALGALYGDGDRPSVLQIARRTDAFRPYRSWVCFLLRVAAARGLIAGVNGREAALRRAAHRPRVAVLDRWLGRPIASPAHVRSWGGVVIGAPLRSRSSAGWGALCAYRAQHPTAARGADPERRWQREVCPCVRAPSDGGQAAIRSETRAHHAGGAHCLRRDAQESDLRATTAK